MQFVGSCSALLDAGGHCSVESSSGWSFARVFSAGVQHPTRPFRSIFLSVIHVSSATDPYQALPPGGDQHDFASASEAAADPN